MSKKLIAVAAAAALALTGLVAPANAAGPFAVDYAGYVDANTTTNTGATALLALKTNVPTADVLRLGTANTATTGTVIRLDVTTPGNTDVITVTTTGGVKVITEAQFDDGATIKDGVSSLTVSAAAGDANIYAFTTSTAAGTVVVSAAGSSKTTYIKGLSTWAYKINFSAPTSVALSGKVAVTGTVKDAFGNDLTTALTFSDFAVAGVGGTDPTAVTYDSVAKTYKFEWVAPATAQAFAAQVGIATAKKPVAVTSLGTPVLAQFFTVTATDLATLVTSLQAEVAALKADYNALAKKYNKKVKKSKRVTLK